MSYFPDLGHVTPVVAGEHVRAVGWFHPDHGYPRGDVPAGFVDRLILFVSRSGESSAALYFGAFAGYHTCQFCGVSHGVNNFGVLGDDVLFVAPEMVMHYIGEHGYQPPAELIEAVLRSPLPDTEEYLVLSEPYWQLHRGAVERSVGEA